MILSAHLGLQGPSMSSHSAMGGSFLGKQLQRGSLIRSQPKMVGSSLYLRPARTPPVSPLALFWRHQGTLTPRNCSQSRACYAAKESLYRSRMDGS